MAIGLRRRTVKLTEAQSVIREVRDHSYWWMKEWGLSIIKEAIRTIRDRQSATDTDLEHAESVSYKIALAE